MLKETEMEAKGVHKNEFHFIVIAQQKSKDNIRDDTYLSQYH
jgi:hypothetical protein